MKASLEFIFRFGDLARIKVGERSGQIGEVIALLWLEPEPAYVLELRDGKSVTLAEQELESTGSSTGRKLTLVKAK
jgi:hypothetical protein